MLPTGQAGKDYIDEIKQLLNAWIQDSAMKKITFKAVMVMPSLILQKPSRNSKAKDHSEALRQRMTLWQSGDLLQLFKEAETIQKGLKDSTKPKSTAQLSKKFVEHTNKGNIKIGDISYYVQHFTISVFAENVRKLSKMADTFTEENMKTLIKEIFQEEFKKQVENITNLISGNFKLTMQEIHGLKNEVNHLRKSLEFTQNNLEEKVDNVEKKNGKARQ